MTPMIKTIDFIVAPRWLVPVDTQGVLTEHAVVVAAGAIVAVLPVAEARAQYPDAPWHALPQHALIPGLINLHCHAAMSLLRGYGDDLSLMPWLNQRIWPAEKRHVSASFVRDGSLLAAAEMLRGGVTTVNDMYFFPTRRARPFCTPGCVPRSASW
jgi:Cytosine deaminase and related metal-dependent hydrolases